MCDRRGLEIVLLHVEQRTEILTHALAVCNPDRFFFEPAPLVFAVCRRCTSGHSGVRPIDDHAEHRADRLPPELDIKYFESVAPRHALRGRTDAFELLT